MDKIKWIFFDVGSTLVDETRAYNHRIEDAIAGTDITFEQFDEKRIYFAKLGLNGDNEAIKHFGLIKTPWHSEDEMPFEDARDTLKALSSRGYKLGIIANQKLGLEKRLESWEMLSCFDAVVYSAKAGFAKPDRRIFETALDSVGCEPHEAVMVGDRLDNDIIPASALGMKTVWIKKHLSVYQNAKSLGAKPNFIIDDLNELKDIFR